MTVLALDVSSVSLRAGRVGETVFALHVPTLQLAPGDRVAVVGPSGCGKSMLLEFLALLVRPERVDRFAIAIADCEMRDLAPDLAAGRVDALSPLRAETLGYIPQSGGVLPFVSARTHALASLYLTGQLRSGAAYARFDKLAEALGLDAHLDKTREQLSGGQRKRVALLAGVSVPRRVLLADEPTTGLDAEASARAMQILATRATEEGTAVLIATHDTEAAQRAGFIIRRLERGTFRYGSQRLAS